MTTSSSVTPQSTYFADLNGSALEGGFIYVGSVGQDAESNLIEIYSDPNLTTRLPNPVRTMGGYPFVAGARAAIYTSGTDCSISIRNSAGVLVDKSLSGNTQILGSSNVLDSISQVPTAANQMLYTIASDTFAVSPITPLARSFLEAGTETEQRAIIGLPISVSIDFENIDPGSVSTRATTFSFVEDYVSSVVRSGTWTPVLVDAAGNPPETAVGTPSGRWSRVGNFVTLNFRLEFFRRGAGNTDTTQLRFEGAPFGLSSSPPAGCHGQMVHFGVTGADAAMLAVAGASADIYLVKSANDDVSNYFRWSDFVVDQAITIGGTVSYFTDDS